jgi:CBS domain-containing protein
MSNFKVPTSLYMTPDVVTVQPDEALDVAYERILEHGISALPVVEEGGRLVGLITRTDLLKVGRRDASLRPRAQALILPPHRVSDEMTFPVRTVTAETPLDEAANLMVTERIHRVFVTDGDRLAGILTTRDLMRALMEKRMNHPVEEFMSSPVFTIRAEETLGLAVERLERARVSGLVVVEDEWPVGVFTQREALEARDVRRNTAVEDLMNPRLLSLAPATRMHRAAAQALAMEVRRVVVQDGDRMVGILSGLDFARAVR